MNEEEKTLELKTPKYLGIFIVVALIAWHSTTGESFPAYLAAGVIGILSGFVILIFTTATATIRKTMIALLVNNDFDTMNSLIDSNKNLSTIWVAVMIFIGWYMYTLTAMDGLFWIPLVMIAIHLITTFTFKYQFYKVLKDINSLTTEDIKALQALAKIAEELDKRM